MGGPDGGEVWGVVGVDFGGDVGVGGEIVIIVIVIVVGFHVVVRFSHISQLERSAETVRVDRIDAAGAGGVDAVGRREIGRCAAEELTTAAVRMGLV